MAFTIMRTAFRTRRSRYISLLVLLALVAATVVLTTTRSAGSDIRSDVQSATATRVAGSIRSDPTAQLMDEALAPVAEEHAPWIVAENERPGTSSWSSTAPHDTVRERSSIAELHSTRRSSHA